MDHPYRFNAVNDSNIEEKWDLAGLAKTPSDFANYKLAINNFLAESVDTFLKDSRISCLRSKPNFQWDLAPGSKYAMRLYFENTSTTMYDRHSALDYAHGKENKYLKPFKTVEEYYEIYNNG